MTTGNAIADTALFVTAVICAIYCTVGGILAIVNGVRRIRKESR
jgi:hypothetical protein